MNIIIINHYAGSEEYGMEFRPLYLGRELVKQGHDVTVIAASYSHLRKLQPKVEKDFEEIFIDGVRYVFVKTPSYKGNGVKRFINIACFYMKIRQKADFLAQKYKPDAVVGSSTYPNDVKLAKLIANKSGGKTAYEIHDIWPLSLMELHGYSPKHPFMRFLQRAENYAYKNSDVVISILPAADRHIKELGFEKVNFVHVPNGVDLSAKKLPAPEDIAREIASFKENGEFVVMYLGGFAKANALDEFLLAAGKVPENTRLVFVGDGFLKKELQEAANKNGFSNVSFFGAVPKSSVLSVLGLADCLYIGAKESGLYKYGIGMNKLFDYMLSGRPVICGINAPGNPVELSEGGIIIKPESPDEIAMAIEKLRSFPDEKLIKMGEKAKQYVIDNHNYKQLAEKFACALK